MGGGSLRPMRLKIKNSGVITSRPQIPAIQKTILANFISSYSTPIPPPVRCFQQPPPKRDSGPQSGPPDVQFLSKAEPGQSTIDVFPAAQPGCWHETYILAD